MKNRTHRQRHRNHLRYLIIGMGLIIIPLLVLLLWDETGKLIGNFQPKKKVANQVIDLNPTQEPLYVEDINRPIDNMHHLINKQKDGQFRRQVYPHSVVDGGVHSVQELRLAIGRDPVVAKHYSNFKLERARVIEAKADRHFHVSYRIGEEIFWTKKKLKVVKGEKLITDGTKFTRTRCANVLSEVPQGRTSPDEPTPEVLDSPLNPPPETTPFVPPVVIVGGPLNPPSDPTPSIPPIVIGEGPLDPANAGNSSDPVPEPATILLLGSGLLGLIAYGRKKFFKK